MEIVRTNSNVPFPQRVTFENAGLDCFSPRSIFLRPHDNQIIDFYIKIGLLPGTWGLLKERSTMGCRGVFVLVIVV